MHKIFNGAFGPDPLKNDPFFLDNGGGIMERANKMIKAVSGDMRTAFSNEPLRKGQFIKNTYHKKVVMDSNGHPVEEVYQTKAKGAIG
jgi:hypothetical protein